MKSSRGTKWIVGVAAAFTLAVLAVWWATDLHAYTKYEVVEQLEVPVAQDDPLAAAGFYDQKTRVETVRRNEFHLGLLPVPQGILDKHALSVATLLGPVWAIAVLLVWGFERRRRRALQPAPQTGS